MNKLLFGDIESMKAVEALKYVNCKVGYEWKVGMYNDHHEYRCPNCNHNRYKSFDPSPILDFDMMKCLKCGEEYFGEEGSQEECQKLVKKFKLKQK